MAEEWILENAHLRMRVASLGGKVQSLYSRHYQAPVLYENPAGGMFPMLPLANRVAGNRFIFQGREIVPASPPRRPAFFSPRRRLAARWV